MADHDLVLVTGAGGMGRLVTERLRTQNVPVRVLIRREDDRAAEMRAWGAEVVTGGTSNVTAIAQAGSEPASATEMSTR
ncbi:NAD-binding protein [Streptomyces sp. NPDC013178]|uniref:NAD-binding protein n=1 Tax=Streptomyces sp. NPDC013178 TaxID=3155118 RepID=UPI0033F00E5A